MLRIAPFPHNADHVLPIEIDGQIDKHDFSNVVSELEQRAEKHDSLRLYVEIKSLGGGTPKAVFDDLKEAIQQWSRFEKIAILCNEDNVRKAADFTDKITSKTEIRTAKLDEQEDMQLWVID